MYAVQFVYPAAYATPKPAVDGVSAKAIQALVSSGSDRERNSDYWFCGSTALKPTGAWDDGVHTRLRFGSRGEDFRFVRRLYKKLLSRNVSQHSATQ